MERTNTLASCGNPTWAWQNRDGKTRTKIDYILIRLAGTSNIISNNGAINWDSIAKQGTSIDHRPVSIEFKITPMSIKYNKPKETNTIYSINRSALLRACAACEQSRKSSMQKNMGIIDTHGLELANQYRDAVRLKMLDDPCAESTSTGKNKIPRAQTTGRNQHGVPTRRKSTKKTVDDRKYACKRCEPSRTLAPGQNSRQRTQNMGMGDRTEKQYDYVQKRRENPRPN